MSENKHHNTVKLIGGKRTNQFITKDSGFYENLERDDQIMADRGFQIIEELLD